MRCMQLSQYPKLSLHSQPATCFQSYRTVSTANALKVYKIFILYWRSSSAIHDARHRPFHRPHRSRIRVFFLHLHDAKLPTSPNRSPSKCILTPLYSASNGRSISLHLVHQMQHNNTSSHSLQCVPPRPPPSIIFINTLLSCSHHLSPIASSQISIHHITEQSLSLSSHTSVP